MMGAWLIQVYQTQFADQISKGGIDGLIKFLTAHNARSAGITDPASRNFEVKSQKKARWPYSHRAFCIQASRTARGRPVRPLSARP